MGNNRKFAIQLYSPTEKTRSILLLKEEQETVFHLIQRWEIDSYAKTVALAFQALYPEEDFIRTPIATMARLADQKGIKFAVFVRETLMRFCEKQNDYKDLLTNFHRSARKAKPTVNQHSTENKKNISLLLSNWRCSVYLPLDLADELTKLRQELNIKTTLAAIRRAFEMYIPDYDNETPQESIEVNAKRNGVTKHRYIIDTIKKFVKNRGLAQ